MPNPRRSSVPPWWRRLCPGLRLAWPSPGIQSGEGQFLPVAPFPGPGSSQGGVDRTARSGPRFQGCASGHSPGCQGVQREAGIRVAPLSQPGKMSCLGENLWSSGAGTGCAHTQEPLALASFSRCSRFLRHVSFLRAGLKPHSPVDLAGPPGTGVAHDRPWHYLMPPISPLFPCSV